MLSAAEMARRRASVEALLAEQGLDHLVFCGLNRAGSAVQWITQWPVTTEAVGVFSPGTPDALFVQYVNHAPLARRFADTAELVEWGGESSIRRAVEIPERRGARADRIGVIGPMTFEQHAVLSARFGKVASLNRAYTRLRQVKSAEELAWFRIGAALSDRGMAGLRDGVRPGLDERELGDRIERTYVAAGGTNVIHFIGVTSMENPTLRCRASSPRPAACRWVTWWYPRSAPPSSTIPARCCAASRSVRSLRRSIATCMRRPTRPSTASRRCCGRARRPPR